MEVRTKSELADFFGSILVWSDRYNKWFTFSSLRFNEEGSVTFNVGKIEEWVPVVVGTKLEPNNKMIFEPTKMRKYKELIKDKQEIIDKQKQTIIKLKKNYSLNKKYEDELK